MGVRLRIEVRPAPSTDRSGLGGQLWQKTLETDHLPGPDDSVEMGPGGWSERPCWRWWNLDGTVTIEMGTVWVDPAHTVSGRGHHAWWSERDGDIAEVLRDGGWVQWRSTGDDDAPRP